MNNLSMPNSGIPHAINHNVMTPEQLDLMINDPNGHPEVRANAKKLKEQLFSNNTEEVEENENIEPEIEELPQSSNKINSLNIPVKKSKPKVEVKPVKTQPKSKPNIKKEEQKSKKLSFSTCKLSDENGVESVIKKISKNIYTDEFKLPTNKDVMLQLRSMTVAEYKLLAKTMDIFEQFISNGTKGGFEDNEIKENETKLVDAIDTVLQRCITNDIELVNMNEFDWIYSILYLRGISRGDEAKFVVTVPSTDNEKGSERKNITVKLFDLLECIDKNVDKFLTEPLGIKEVDDDISLYVSVPTRNDIIFIDNNPMEEFSYNSMKAAMCIKAYIKDNVAYILSPEQKLKIYSSLTYEMMEEIHKLHDTVYDSFFEVINTHIKETYGDYGGLRFSDFILSFYDF